MYFLPLFDNGCVIKAPNKGGDNRCKIVNNDGNNFFMLSLGEPTKKRERAFWRLDNVFSHGIFNVYHWQVWEMEAGVEIKSYLDYILSFLSFSFSFFSLNAIREISHDLMQTRAEGERKITSKCI